MKHLNKYENFSKGCYWLIPTKCIGLSLKKIGAPETFFKLISNEKLDEELELLKNSSKFGI